MNEVIIPRLSRDLIFPNPRHAIEEGLLAYGGDLSISRLLTAYRKGIFPWYSEGDPILWWSPDPRLVLYPYDLKISKSLAKIIKKKKYEVRVDTAFRQVVENCRKAVRKDQEGTWILPEVVDAYTDLHKYGYAHSFESWLDGRLVGGLYGISLGGGFFGESMFSLEPDASKIALNALCNFCQKYDFDFIDCQVSTDHLLRMGAVEVERELFLLQLEKALLKKTYDGNWSTL